MRAWLLAAAVVLPACALAVPTPTRVATIVVPTAAPTATAPTAVLPQPTVGDLDADDPRWPVIGFLRGWQRRDAGAMAMSVEAVDPTNRATLASILRDQYDFRPLRGAEVVGVETLGPAGARVTARVWYEAPPGRLERKRLALAVFRTDAPRTAATGPSPWRVAFVSLANEQDDP